MEDRLEMQAGLPATQRAPPDLQNMSGDIPLRLLHLLQLSRNEQTYHLSDGAIAGIIMGLICLTLLGAAIFAPFLPTNLPP